MTRGTTPTLIFHFCQDIDLTLVDKIIVTFQQGGIKLFDKQGEQVTRSKFLINFTQEETLQMKPATYLLYQARMLVGEKSFSTPIYKTMVYDTLNGEVLQ